MSSHTSEAPSNVRLRVLSLHPALQVHQHLLLRLEREAHTRLSLSIACLHTCLAREQAGIRRYREVQIQRFQRVVTVAALDDLLVAVRAVHLLVELLHTAENMSAATTSAREDLVHLLAERARSAARLTRAAELILAVLANILQRLILPRTRELAHSMP